MPYHVLAHFFHKLETLPPKYHYEMAIAFGGIAYITDKIKPDSIGTATALIIALTGLLGAWRATAKQRNDDARKEREEKRKDKILEAQLDKFRKENLTPLARNVEVLQENLVPLTRNVEVLGKGMQQNRKGLQEVTQRTTTIEKSVKGLEQLRDLGLIKTDCPDKKSILVVDDDPATLRVWGQIFSLNLAPFNLWLASTYEEALARLETRPDCMLLDLGLGGDRSGLELVAQAKSYNDKIKVVIVTGRNNPEEIQLTVQLGIEILKKPFTNEDIAKLIRILQKDFGSAPSLSSESIPVVADPGIPPGTAPGASSA